MFLVKVLISPLRWSRRLLMCRRKQIKILILLRRTLPSWKRSGMVGRILWNRVWRMRCWVLPTEKWSGHTLLILMRRHVETTIQSVTITLLMCWTTWRHWQMQRQVPILCWWNRKEKTVICSAMICCRWWLISSKRMPHWREKRKLICMKRLSTSIASVAT